jgi:hypothetical protein
LSATTLTASGVSCRSPASIRTGRLSPPARRVGACASSLFVGAYSTRSRNSRPDSTRLYFSPAGAAISTSPQGGATTGSLPLRGAGLDYRPPYALRHTFCAFSIADGTGLFELARMMGTSVERISNTYGHLLPTDTFDALDVHSASTRRKLNRGPKPGSTFKGRAIPGTKPLRTTSGSTPTPRLTSAPD